MSFILMKCSFIFLLMSLGSLSFGTELETEQSKSAVENAPILDEVTYQTGKDTLVIQRIEQPDFLEETEESERPQILSDEEQEPPKEVELPISTYVIIATTHGEKGTKIKIWPAHLGERNSLEGWSNVNWSYFQNLISINDLERRYQFMLFHSAAQSTQTVEQAAEGQNLADFPQIPPELPDFKATGARYLVTSGEETERVETLDFLEALHVLYDEAHQELRQEREEAILKQEERARRIKIEDAKPKTRVLKIWRHKRPLTKATQE